MRPILIINAQGLAEVMFMPHENISNRMKDTGKLFRIKNKIEK